MQRYETQWVVDKRHIKEKKSERR